MMPAIDPRSDARRKRARVAMFINAGAIMASSALAETRFSGWRGHRGSLASPHPRLHRHLHEFRRRPAWPPRDKRAQRRDRAAGDRFDGLVAHRWDGLSWCPRMMPGPLAPVAAKRRACCGRSLLPSGHGVRSYLLSGPLWRR